LLFSSFYIQFLDMANNIFSGIGSRSPIDGESRMTSSIMESISKLPSFTADTEIQRFQTGGMAFHFPAGSSYGESGMSGVPSLTPAFPTSINDLYNMNIFEGNPYDLDTVYEEPVPWDTWDIYGNPTPWWYNQNNPFVYSDEPSLPTTPPVSTPPVEQPPVTTPVFTDTEPGTPWDTGTQRPWDIYGTETPWWYDPNNPFVYSDAPTSTPTETATETATEESVPPIDEIVSTGQQPSWFQNWFPWMAGLGSLVGLGAGAGASTAGATTPEATAPEATTTEGTTGAEADSAGLLSGIGLPGLGAIPLIAGAVATEEENGGDPYIPQAQPYVPPMGSLIPSQVTSNNPFVYSPLNVGDYASISGYLDPRTMYGDQLGYTPYLGSGIGGLLPQSEYVPGVSDMWNDNWAYPMSMESMDPSWRPSMPWELSNMPANLYTQPPPPPPDETPPPDDTTPVTPVISPDVPINIPPIISGVGPNLPFDPETYDWSGIMNQYQPQIPTTPDLSQYALKTDLPTMPEIPSVTQFNPETYDWSGIMSQYQPTMPEMPEIPSYAPFDPTGYDWSNVFNQYQQNIPNIPEMPEIPNIPSTFDPVGYDWSNVFDQYQQNIPEWEMPQIPEIPSVFDPTGYDWGNIFNQYQQNIPEWEMPETPSYTPFDPIGYDWGNIFNQYQQNIPEWETPEIPSYAPFDPTSYNWGNIFDQYQQNMPSFEAPDLSDYVTQGGLTAGLGSLPNYNAEIRALSDRMNALNARFDNYQPTQNYNQPGLGLFT